MTTPVWPQTPPPSFSYPFDDEYETLVSEYQGTNEQAQTLRRFPKVGFMVGYELLLIGSDWATIHNFHTARRGQWETFWYFDFISRPWTDLKIGRGDGSTATFDLPSKNTVHDSSLKVYVNGSLKTEGVDYNFSAGTGEGSADQIVFIAGHIPALGALITTDLKGNRRIKARKDDKFADKMDQDDVSNIQVFRIRNVG
jgi:hypothetical protein